MEQELALIENASVPSLSIAFMAFSAFMGLAIPVGVSIYLKKKYKCHYIHFFVGCGVWILFAMIIESVVHNLILGLPIGATIQGNPWLLGIYGGIMAALFEEFGRFTAFKTILENKMDNDKEALMYGVGHGGVECAIILTVGMISNLICAFLINSGMGRTLVEPLLALDETTAKTTFDSLMQLVNEPSSIFVVGLVERIAAVTGHMAMTVPVWFAVKNKKFSLMFISLGMHFFLDAATYIINSYVDNMWILEFLVYIIVAAMVFVAVKVYRKESMDTIGSETMSTEGFAGTDNE